MITHVLMSTSCEGRGTLRDSALRGIHRFHAPDEGFHIGIERRMYLKSPLYELRTEYLGLRVKIIVRDTFTNKACIKKALSCCH